MTAVWDILFRALVWAVLLAPLLAAAAMVVVTFRNQRAGARRWPRFCAAISALLWLICLDIALGIFSKDRGLPVMALASSEALPSWFFFWAGSALVAGLAAALVLFTPRMARWLRRLNVVLVSSFVAVVSPALGLLVVVAMFMPPYVRGSWFNSRVHARVVDGYGQPVTGVALEYTNTESMSAWRSQLTWKSETIRSDAKGMLNVVMGWSCVNIRTMRSHDGRSIDLVRQPWPNRGVPRLCPEHKERYDRAHPLLLESEPMTRTASGSIDIWSLVEAHLSGRWDLETQQAFPAPDSARTADALYAGLTKYFRRERETLRLTRDGFHAGLSQRFFEHEGLYYAAEPAEREAYAPPAEPDRELRTEADAVAWLLPVLRDKPSSYHELLPRFVKNTQRWSRYELPIGLEELLRQNCSAYTGRGDPGLAIKSRATVERIALDTLKRRIAAKDWKTYLWVVNDDPASGQSRGEALEREYRRYAEFSGRRLDRVRLAALLGHFAGAIESNPREVLQIADRLPDGLVVSTAELRRLVAIARQRAEHLPSK